MKTKLLAILKHTEEECDNFKYGHAYKFKYRGGVFKIKLDGVWIEAPGTIFDLISIKK